MTKYDELVRMYLNLCEHLELDPKCGVEVVLHECVKQGYLKREDLEEIDRLVNG
ncbi:hypothetical protein J2S00_002499 [Caldalkalibacillus uzonensis]|uniref:Uncharacterized protein n=1 Tax=Caldalkalibacillus uzonensis TaxID=353224 RepID=A0ABU0CUY4_9BACI|nr:hypothetical protein [Caldalkalibacillus uzonensis]MDQ0339706.1 hypothetical protein [Caldalkalibacillus uzonensis]